MIKPTLTALKMMPLLESVMVSLFTKSIDEKGVFTANELQESHAQLMLDALVRWHKALAPMRA